MAIPTQVHQGPLRHPAGALQLARRAYYTTGENAAQAARELARLCLSDRATSIKTLPALIDAFYAGKLTAELFDVLSDGWADVEAERAMQQARQQVDALDLEEPTEGAPA